MAKGIKTIERKITITYNWYRGDKKPIKPEHIPALEERAMDRIKEMMAQGYISGELHDDVRMDDEDGDDGIEYSGWWDTKTEDVADPD